MASTIKYVERKLLKVVLMYSGEEEERLKISPEKHPPRNSRKKKKPARRRKIMRLENEVNGKKRIFRNSSISLDSSLLDSERGVEGVLLLNESK